MSYLGADLAEFAIEPFPVSNVFGSCCVAAIEDDLKHDIVLWGHSYDPDIEKCEFLMVSSYFFEVWITDTIMANLISTS